MKYAFIMGSNAFIVTKPVISFTDGEHDKEILRIKSFIQETKTGKQGFFTIDADVQDDNGDVIKITDNQLEVGSVFKVTAEQNLIKILKGDSLVFEVLQLDEDAAMDLEHNIVAELEVNSPFVAIRIFGDFIVEGLHVSAENEKLYVNDNGYATSALAGKGALFLTKNGVLL